MRVIFMGTPEFAVPSLLALAESYDVVAAYTRADAVSGRGVNTRPSPVKLAAHDLGIPVRQPATLRDAEEVAKVRAFDADLIVVAAYGLILPVEVLAAASLGAINVHASLLPRWRGAAPIQRAILAEDEFTGVSIMKVEEGLDTGPYCLQLQTLVADKTACELTEELSRLGADALRQALPAIADGTAVWTRQDEALATYAAKVTKDDLSVDPDLPARDLALRVRASLPAAPARALIAGRGVTLLNAHADAGVGLNAGAVAVGLHEVFLGARDGAVAVTLLKPDGKAQMSASDWARGVRDLATATWERAR